MEFTLNYLNLLVIILFIILLIFLIYVFTFPSELLRGEITPVFRNKKDNRFDSNNYRSIMQSSCLFKLCEMHLLNYLNDIIYFNCKQFGFYHGISTTEACFLLKETIYNYKSNLIPA